MPRLSKSTVITEEFQHSDTIMILRRTYTYVNGADAKRPVEKTKKKLGWTWVATSTKGHKSLQGHTWIVDEVYVKTPNLTWKIGK